MKNNLTISKLIIRIIIALIILITVMILCSFCGSEDVSLTKIFKGPVVNSTINPDYVIFFRIRVPRIILAALVGAGLACSGAVLQALLRNPLADPYILGISSGAGLGATIAIICGLEFTFSGGSPASLFAFIGALSTVWLVWVIGRFTAKAHVTGLLLAGVVVNAFFSAVIMFLTTIAKSEQVHSTIFWLMGNITEKEIYVIWFSGGFILTGIIALYFLSPQLNVISFSENDARALGIHTAKIQAISLVIAAVITSIAVSLSGLIGFVGLIVPHAVRLTLGPDHRQLIPISAITGAVFLILADTLARIIVAPAQLPVGVVTAIAGGPFFLLLLIKYTHRVGWLGK